MYDRYRDLISIIRIINTPGVGSVTFFKLLKSYHSIDKVLEILPYMLKDGVVIPSVNFAAKEIEEADKNNIKIILWNDNEYPNQLKDISSKPVLLYAKGNYNLLNNKSIGIVGTRNPTIVGKNFIFDLSKYLVKYNFKIISGMALGIDAYVHKGAIDSTAETIAVLAGGVNDIYPQSNKSLYNEIISKGGLILSEQSINYVAKANDFPKRNRIIAGLSNVLIVSEATNRSGSLITAQYAIKQKKLIYCIPLHPSDARSYGPNNLIDKGAKIFVSKEKLISDLQKISDISDHTYYDESNTFTQTPIKNTINDQPESKIEDYLLNIISVCPVGIEELFQDINDKYNISISEFSKLILQMELHERIINLNGYISKVSSI